MPSKNNPPMSLVPLSAPAAPTPKRPGRPASLVMPPLPSEITQGMTEIEKQHFDFFVESYSQAYQKRYKQKTSPTALINITQAAIDYVHLLRLQAEQIKAGVLVSQARQHPGVQVRAWLASAGLQEKDLEAAVQDEKSEEKSDLEAALLALSVN